MATRRRNREIEGIGEPLQARGKASRWELYRLPVELSGRSFCDVGCWEGVHCADAVRHGSPDVVGVDIFSDVKFVDVIGTSKGKGTAGVMKRHHFGGQPASHVTERKHRAPGSPASRWSRQSGSKA